VAIFKIFDIRQGNILYSGYIKNLGRVNFFSKVAHGLF